MADVNLGQAIVDAWSKYLKQPYEQGEWLQFALDGKPGKAHKPPSDEQRAQWKREELAYKRKARREKAKFKGEIVATEGDLYDLTLVYADGRRLRLYESSWVEAK